jgi:hypothetical protein
MNENDELKVVSQRYPTDIAKRDEILNRFTYHAPKEGQADRYVLLRDRAFYLAELFTEQCPQSRELSLALTKLEESVFWANAAIARNE